MPSVQADQHKSSETVHASCVSLAGRGLLIRGQSGSGKSALALQLMAYGCDLVADDRVALAADQGEIIAQAPEHLPNLVEARGLGLLHAELAGPAKLSAVVDMDVVETDRLPRPREIYFNGHKLHLFRKVEGAHFAAALFQFLKKGLRDPECPMT